MRLLSLAMAFSTVLLLGGATDANFSRTRDIQYAPIDQATRPNRLVVLDGFSTCSDADPPATKVDKEAMANSTAAIIGVFTKQTTPMLVDKRKDTRASTAAESTRRESPDAPNKCTAAVAAEEACSGKASFLRTTKANAPNKRAGPVQGIVAIATLLMPVALSIVSMAVEVASAGKSAGIIHEGV